MLKRRIAQLRLAHGESLREAAARTGVSHTTLARLENGQVTASTHRTFKKIADGYGVPVEWLQTGREEHLNPDAQVKVKAIIAQVVPYIEAVQAAAGRGLSPQAADRFLRLASRASTQGVEADEVELAIDRLSAKKPG